MNLLDYLPEEDGRQAAQALLKDRQKVLDARQALASKPLQRQTAAMYASVADWLPPNPPDLSRDPEIILDFETSGLRWWENDRPIGVGVLLPTTGQTYYLPWGHRGGQNLDEATVKRWFEREVRGKRIVNLRTKFDCHMARAWGIDLEAQGCTFGDVAHYAALLDDHRRLFNQEALVVAFLKDDAGKLRAAHGYDLNPQYFADYPAGLVAPRAENDVWQVSRLLAAMWPQLTDQDLHRVHAVEDALIPVVVEMEHNGVPLDVERLNAWCAQSEQDILRILHEIEVEHSVRMESPTKRDDIMKLLHALHVPIPMDAETDKPTIADDALAAIPHPTILKLRTAMALASLRSKFLLKYQRTLDSHGILRYELHQLPYEDDEQGGGGAVSGRFSSAAMQYYDVEGKKCYAGANIQQVFGVKSQKNPKRAFNPTQDYIIRSLFKPDRRACPTAVWFSSDMRQIEYRRFVHYSEAERLIDAYRQDPLTDYHVLMHSLVLEHTGQDFERTHVKNLNFGSIYGAGLIKLAHMTGEITEHVYRELREIQERSGFKTAHADPRVAKTRTLYETYHGMFPEVRRLLGLASRIAENRGYVRTILGRRARFYPGDRMYSALNRVIQGTAADDHKVALIDVHQERHRLGLKLRFSVHDEIGGDLFDGSTLPQIAEFLNKPRLESRVPILWESHIGESWADAK